MPRNTDQPEVQLHVGTFDVYVVAHVSSRTSIFAILILRHQYAFLVSSPGSFDRRLFSYVITKRQKTSAFVTGKCRLYVKSVG